jgi:FkbM family methyltransferase
MFWFVVAKLYIKIYGVFRDRFGVTLRGMGFMLRMIRSDHVLNVAGRKLFFNHNVGTCYNRLVNGDFNEPETHAFLRRIFQSISGQLMFVDVGANIGEMIVDAARYPNVVRLIGFEPNAECARACRESAVLNGDRHIEIVQKVLNADGVPVRMFADAIPLASSIVDKGDRNEVTVEATTLDKELMKYAEPAVVLIDVEGAETLVLKGGKVYIERSLPLIVFEYNQVSRKFFSLDDISEILGNSYSIFRLRGDGKLDGSFAETWNCVAVPSGSIFSDICRSLIVE